MAEVWTMNQAVIIATGISCLVVYSLTREGSLSLVLFILLPTAITLLAVWKIILYPKLLSPLRHFPGPPGGSFFHGQLWRILREPTGAPMRDWINNIPNDGVIRFTTVCNQERLLITSPEALREVLVAKNYDWDKPKQMRQGLGRILGFGLLLASGNDHKKHLTPAFSYRVIKDLYPVFWTKSCELVKEINHHINTKSSKILHNTAKNEVVPISDWLRRATLDIIGTAGMGYEFNALLDPDNEVSKTYARVFETSQNSQLLGFIETMENLVPVAWLGGLPLKYNLDIKASAKKIREISKVLIAEKIQKLSNHGALDDKDMLAVAIRSGNFSDDTLVDQVMTFLAAGHETVSTAMSWALTALCQYPEIQTRLRSEVRAQIPSPADESVTITAEKLDSLPYLQAVCQEVLRYYPPVPLSRRECVKDTTILGHVIHKGTNILLVPLAINFSKSLWGDDALEFNPERWLGPNRANSGGSTSNFANMTFIHGPRSCIGASFAKAELACLLGSVVGRFEMVFAEPDKKIEIMSGGVTLKQKHDLALKMKALDGW